MFFRLFFVITLTPIYHQLKRHAGDTTDVQVQARKKNF